MKTSSNFSRLNYLLARPLQLLTIIVVFVAVGQTAFASPFGEGNFGAQVPFGSLTSLSISLGGNVNLSLAPSGGNFSAQGSSTITVTSTDVVGYSLYIYTPGHSSMTNSGGSIPASSNSSEAPLATNTWGYNDDGSTNYIGMTTTPVLLTTLNGPYESGNTTTVTYGVLTSIATAEGSYSATVTYTAVCLNQW